MPSIPMPSFLLTTLALGAASLVLAIGLRQLSAECRPADAARWHGVWAAFLALVTVTSGAGLIAVADGGWAMWLAVVVTAAALVRLGSGWWRVRRIAAMAEPPTAPHAVRLRAAYQQAGGPMPRFLIHPRLQTALTWGWRRPVVMLPATWAGWPADRLDAVVRHELAHVRRGDYLTSLLAAVAGALLWFLPGIWIARSQLRWFAELAADHRVAAAVGRESYARHLMAAAGVRPGDWSAFGLRFAPGQVTLVNGAGVDRAELRRRVEALVGDGPLG